LKSKHPTFTKERPLRNQPNRAMLKNRFYLKLMHSWGSG
jgi:hypothetical protein